MAVRPTAGHDRGSTHQRLSRCPERPRIRGRDHTVAASAPATHLHGNAGRYARVHPKSTLLQRPGANSLTYRSALPRLIATCAHRLHKKKTTAWYYGHYVIAGDDKVRGHELVSEYGIAVDVRVEMFGLRLHDCGTRMPRQPTERTTAAAGRMRDDDTAILSALLTKGCRLFVYLSPRMAGMLLPPRFGNPCIKPAIRRTAGVARRGLTLCEFAVYRRTTVDKGDCTCWMGRVSRVETMGGTVVTFPPARLRICRIHPSGPAPA
jgi:hypothetical protein